MTAGKAATTTVWSKAVENTPKQRIPKITDWDEPSAARRDLAAFTTLRLHPEVGCQWERQYPTG